MARGPNRYTAVVLKTGICATVTATEDSGCQTELSIDAHPFSYASHLPGALRSPGGARTRGEDHKCHFIIPAGGSRLKLWQLRFVVILPFLRLFRYTISVQLCNRAGWLIRARLRQIQATQLPELIARSSSCLFTSSPGFNGSIGFSGHRWIDELYSWLFENDGFCGGKPVVFIQDSVLVC